MNEAVKTVPHAQREIKITPIEELRFWVKVNKDGPTMPGMETPCWLWTASKVKGYGAFGLVGGVFRAHRVSWTLHQGPIPCGLYICHHCDNPSCVNPAHLFLGTHADNVRDMDKKGRRNPAYGDRSGSRTHPESLLRGESSPKSKLTDLQVVEIRKLRESGNTLNSIALQFGVDQASISRIANRKSWAHIS